MKAQPLRCRTLLRSVFSILFGSAGLAVAAVAAPAQTISLDRTSGPDGTYIKVTGSGFDLNSGGATCF